MTTIACRDGEMAADTQCTGDYTLRMQKIMQLADGSIVGMAGSVSEAYAAASWLANGSQGEPPKFKGASLLILKPDASLWMADNAFPAFPLLDKMAAIGSGAQAAMVAMQQGATAAAAVKVAAKIDPYTSEPIQLLALERKPRRKRRA